MSYWHGNAPRYSRKVEAASMKVRAAEEAMLAAMEDEYPKGSTVRVVHSRGAFYGTVEGYDKFGCRIRIRNNASGKKSKWWTAQVELA